MKRKSSPSEKIWFISHCNSYYEYYSSDLKYVRFVGDKYTAVLKLRKYLLKKTDIFDENEVYYYTYGLDKIDGDYYPNDYVTLDDAAEAFVNYLTAIMKFKETELVRYI